MPLNDIAPVINMGLLCVLIVWVAAIAYKARGWSVPVQDAKLRDLRNEMDLTTAATAGIRRGVDSAHNKADALQRELEHERTRHLDTSEAVVREVRSVGSQVQLLLEMRDELAEVRAQTLRVEQDLSSLACFEQQRAAKVDELPRFCPLRKIDCPLAQEAE